MLEDTCGPEPMSPSSGRKLFASASSNEGSESSSASSREICRPAEAEGGSGSGKHGFARVLRQKKMKFTQGLRDGCRSML